MFLISDWWRCAETRRKINAEQNKRAAEQIAEINRAYKAAKIPGATPQHWLGKISRMNKLGRQMPKELEHLAGSTVDANTLAFIESAKPAAAAYFTSKYAEIRAQNFRSTQQEYGITRFAKQSQYKGGVNSGAARKLKRDEAVAAIVDAYKKANPKVARAKPVARLVADWYVRNYPTSKSTRNVKQMLQRAGAAT